MTAALPVILLFLAGMTFLGVWHARRIRSAEDFALAGRKLGVPVLAGTLVATWIGTGSLFGNAEFTYEHGVAGFFLPISGMVGILVLAWLAPRIRKLPVASVPEILGYRFGRPAQVLGAVALIGAYLVIVSYQYRAGAAVAQRLFPDLVSSGAGGGGGALWLFPVAFALFVILYTALAGMVSVALTDVVNGVIMSLGLILGLFLLLGRWDPSVQPLPQGHASPGGGLGVSGWINAMLPSFLLILGDANLAQRFLSARSPGTARRAALATFLGLLVLESAIIGLALLGSAMLPVEPANHGHVIIEEAFALFPPVVGILLAATAVAVIVSTADSYLLACATTTATDLGGGMTTPRRQRILVVLLGLAALGLAFTSDRFFKVALWAYTLYGASLTPAVLCALLRPHTPPRAVVGGMAAGLITALAWQAFNFFGVLPSGLGQWDAVLPALAANLGVLLLLAWRGRPAPAAIRIEN